MREYNDYVLTVRRWLRSYEDLKVTLENLRDDIEMLTKLNQLDVAAAISKYGDSPRGGTPELNGVESAAERHILREGKIRDKRHSAEAIELLLRKIDRTLLRLPEAEERLLRGHFIEGVPWEELGEEYGYTEKWARSHGGNALRRVASMLFGERVKGSDEEQLSFVFAK